MSSIMDSGYYADEAIKTKEEKCPKGGEHDWKKHGSWPSEWEVCKKCKTHIYWK